MMNADEARRFVAGKVFAFACFDGTRGAGRIFEDGGAAGAVQFSAPVRCATCAFPAIRSRSAASPSALDQGTSVRAVLQPRQARRAQLPRIGLGHGFRVLRFPSSRRRADAASASSRPAAFAASAGADRLGGSIRGARRDPATRETKDRAGQIRDEIRAFEIGKRSRAAPFDRLIGA